MHASDENENFDVGELLEKNMREIKPTPFSYTKKCSLVCFLLLGWPTPRLSNYKRERLVTYVGRKHMLENLILLLLI